MDTREWQLSLGSKVISVVAKEIPSPSVHRADAFFTVISTVPVVKTLNLPSDNSTVSFERGNCSRTVIKLIIGIILTRSDG